MQILVGGIGNVFHGDDAFGVEVVRALGEIELPPDVAVVDFGIRGFDLAEALTRTDAAILVDAIGRGQVPGTVQVLEIPADGGSPVAPDAHSLHPEAVLRLVSQLGARPRQVFLVGCEPATLEMSEDGSGRLSPAVAAAVPHARDAVVALVHRLLERPEVAASA